MFSKINITLIIFVTMVFGNDFVSIKQNKINFDTTQLKKIQEYRNLQKSIDSTSGILDGLGFISTYKGILSLYDYKFEDGFIKADYKKAEKYFRKAVKEKDNNAYYFLAFSLVKQNKTDEALSLLNNRLKFFNSFKTKSESMTKDYLILSNLYAGIVLDSNKDTKSMQQAITYSYDAAYYKKNSIAQLEIGLLYLRIGKKKPSNYFISQACLNNKKNPFVEKYCKENIEIKKKNCTECEIKKKLELL